MQEKRGAGIVAAVFVSVVILGGAIFYRLDGAKQTHNSLADTIIATSPQKDTDGDGLEDAEEEKWGTDSARKDTDGDGTNDYVEVLTGRDPNEPAPYDVIDGSRLSITNLFVDDVVVGYNEIINDDGTVDKEEEDEFIKTVAGKYAEALAVTDLYTTDDLYVVGDTNANKKQYQLMLGNILKVFDEIEEQEIMVIFRYDKTKDIKELAKIDKSIEVYDRVITELTTMPIPESATSVHLSLVNSIYKFNRSLISIRLTAIDPLRGTVGAETFLKSEEELIAAVVNLGAYLAQNL